MAENKDVNSNDILHYSKNRTCFLSNEDFDYMIAANNEAEEAIGWKVLPENTVYRVEKCLQFKPSGDFDASFIYEL